MTDEEKVKAKWPDAELSKAFAMQPDRKTKRWMWCATSTLKWLATRRQKRRVCNIGEWKFSEAEAWADAASRLAPQGAGDGGERCQTTNNSNLKQNEIAPNVGGKMR